MIRKFVLLFAILVLFAGQALASEAVIEQLRLKVPESQVRFGLRQSSRPGNPGLSNRRDSSDATSPGILRMRKVSC